MGDISLMQAGSELELITTEEYLKRERESDVRHEYIGGLIYAMADTSVEHNIIKGNMLAALHSHLRGKPCRVFATDLKVRLEIAHTDIFYYPDIFVSCDPADADRYFKRNPKIVIEVLSETTEIVDRREKFMSYTQIPSLEEYLLVAQDRMEVTIFRRANKWQPELLSQPAEVLRLGSLQFTLPLSAIYEGISLRA